MLDLDNYQGLDNDDAIAEYVAAHPETYVEDDATIPEAHRAYCAECGQHWVDGRHVAHWFAPYSAYTCDACEGQWMREMEAAYDITCAEGSYDSMRQLWVQQRVFIQNNIAQYTFGYAAY